MLIPDGSAVSVRRTVHISLEEGVGTVRIARPERHNALTAATFGELVAGFRGLGEDPECRVVVLGGDGPSFCSGLDLTEGMGETLEQVLATMRVATDVVAEMRRIPQPVVAAGHGLAIGAGISLLAAADLRVLAPDTSLRAVFTGIGMSAGDLGLSWILPRLLGPGAASEIFYTAADLSAADALRLGFANHVSDAPWSTAMDIARRIAERAPLAVRMTKDLLNASVFGPGFAEHLELEMRTQLICAHTADHGEAVRAFRERRPAVFGRALTKK